MVRSQRRDAQDVPHRFRQPAGRPLQVFLKDGTIDVEAEVGKAGGDHWRPRSFVLP